MNHKINYNLDSSYLDNEISFNINKINNLPKGNVLAKLIYDYKNTIYIYGGLYAGKEAASSLSTNSTFDKLEGIFNKGFDNCLYSFNINTKIFKCIRELNEILPRKYHFFTFYNDSIYIGGGIFHSFLDQKYLDHYKKIHNKWPPKANKVEYDDFYKININDNFRITKIGNFPFNINVEKTVLINNNLYILFLFKLKYKTFEVFKNKKIDDNTNVIIYLNLDSNTTDLHFLTCFPGTVRYYPEFLNYKNEYLFIIGGFSFLKENDLFRENEKASCSILDNWKYNILDNSWQRICNTPLLGLSNFGGDIFNDKIIFYGGVRRYKTLLLDENKKENIVDLKEENKYNLFKPYFQYGKCSNLISIYNEEYQKHNTNLEKSGSYPYYMHYFSDMIMIYDINLNTFKLSTTKLPVNINGSFNHKKINNKLYIMGGEINDTLINDKFYGINTNLCFEIDILFNK